MTQRVLPALCGIEEGPEHFIRAFPFLPWHEYGDLASKGIIDPTKVGPDKGGIARAQFIAKGWTDQPHVILASDTIQINDVFRSVGRFEDSWRSWIVSAGAGVQ